MLTADRKPHNRSEALNDCKKGSEPSFSGIGSFLDGMDGLQHWSYNSSKVRILLLEIQSHGFFILGDEVLSGLQ